MSKFLDNIHYTPFFSYISHGKLEGRILDSSLLLSLKVVLSEIQLEHNQANIFPWVSGGKEQWL